MSGAEETKVKLVKLTDEQWLYLKAIVEDHATDAKRRKRVPPAWVKNWDGARLALGQAEDIE